ncbi:peptidoglycan-binding protein [bacterium 1xD8-6]|nr:peptidoglycan-binding protein [bacterium D16-36]RKI69597.1 peptidoglycan-binding protein [bacterium 1xD8-6]
MRKGRWSFWQKTKNAIKKFQKEEGLSVNGNINKALLRKLKINI